MSLHNYTVDLLLLGGAIATGVAAIDLATHFGRAGFLGPRLETALLMAMAIGLATIVRF